MIPKSQIVVYLPLVKAAHTQDGGLLMLTISKSKLSELRSAQLDKYKTDLVRYFRENFTRETEGLNDNSLADIVSKNVDGGLERGIETSEAMSRYVGLAVLVNPNFSEQKDVIELFEYSGFDPDYKVHLLSDMLTRKLKSV